MKKKIWSKANKNLPTKEYLVIAYMFKLAVSDFEIITINMKIAKKKKLMKNFNGGKSNFLKKIRLWKYNI